MSIKHQSVLLKEVIDGLDLHLGETYLDATSGSGGHLEEVWQKMRGEVILIGIDLDQRSLEITKKRLAEVSVKAKLVQLDFRDIDRVLKMVSMKNPDKILFDLGWSSDQFEQSGRGFSFQKDEPLLMTFKKEVEAGDTTASDVVNDWSETSLADVIYGYGEERYARRIAKAIILRRAQKPIVSSGELVEIIKDAVPIAYRFGRIHPATRTFQAIRIAVNDELRALETGLINAFEILNTGGRLAVISFHSLEDRIVKNFFKSKKENGLGELINKKPIIPNESEIKTNPRSRSAKLRILRKISG